MAKSTQYTGKWQYMDGGREQNSSVNNYVMTSFAGSLDETNERRAGES